MSKWLRCCLGELQGGRVSRAKPSGVAGAQKWRGRQFDSFDIHWRRWSLSSTSPVNIKAVILTTFLFQYALISVACLFGVTGGQYNRGRIGHVFQWIFNQDGHLFPAQHFSLVNVFVCEILRLLVANTWQIGGYIIRNQFSVYLDLSSLHKS